MKLNEKIALYLKENGIKQTWLADQVGMSISTLNAILLGKQRMTADTFELICTKGIKVNPGIFFDNKFLDSKKTGTEN